MPQSRAFVVAFGFALAISRTAEAQQNQFELVPFIGGYVPATGLGSVNVLIGTATRQVKGDGATAAALGGRFTYWPNERLGVEGSYFYSHSKLRYTSGPVADVQDAHIQAGSLVATYRATPGTTGTDAVLRAGLMGISHEGPGFQLATGQTDVGGTIGGGLRILMASQMTFRLDGDGYIYRWSGGPSLGSAVQVDLVISAGIALKFGTR